MNYKQPLTIHIQGLPFNTSSYFQEIDESQHIDIPYTSSIKAVSIEKIGGYRPQKMELIFTNLNHQLEGQAYMVRYVKGNLEATPIEDEVDTHSGAIRSAYFVRDTHSRAIHSLTKVGDTPLLTKIEMSDHLCYLRLYIPLDLTDGWVGIYSNDGLSNSFTYDSVGRKEGYIELVCPPLTS